MIQLKSNIEALKKLIIYENQFTYLCCRSSWSGRFCNLQSIKEKRIPEPYYSLTLRIGTAGGHRSKEIFFRNKT